MTHLISILIGFTHYERQGLLMTTQDIKAIKVLSIITTVAVLEEALHKISILKQTLQLKLKITTCLVATLYIVNKKNQTKLIEIKKIRFK